MQYIVRYVGGFAWLAAVALTVILVREYTSGQNVVTVGVAMLAIAMSGLGLLLARYSWERRAVPELLLGIAIWTAGFVYLTTTELGYWASTYDQRYAEYQREKKAEARRDGVTDLAWKALTTGQLPVSSAQVEADISAKQLDPIYSRSKQCAEATQPASRKVCAEIFALRSQLAAARQRESLESEVAKAKPKTDTVAPVMNIFANAEMFARRFGGNERDWADFITLAGWLVLMLVRDAGLLVANPLGRSREARRAVKAPRGMDVAAPPVLPVLPRQEPQESPLQHIKGGDSLSPPSDDTPPPADVKPVAEAPAPPAEESPRAKVVLVTEGWKPEPKLTAAEKRSRDTERRNAEAIKAVKAFAAECLSLGEIEDLPRNPSGRVVSGGMSVSDIGAEFRSWAKASKKWRQFGTYHKNPLGKALGLVIKSGKYINGHTVYAAAMKEEKLRAIG